MPEGMPGAAPAASAPRAGPVLPLIRPRTGVAWAVIAAVFLVVQGMHLLPGDDGEGSAAVSLEMMRQGVQQQYGVAAVAEGLGAGPAAGMQVQAFEGFATGPVPQRQRHAVVVADLLGPKAARDRLDAMERLLAERKRVLGEEERRVEDALRRLYAGDARPHDPSVLTDAERATLREGLGWFGELALAPRGSPGREAVLAPARTMATRQLLLVAAILGVLGLGLLGGLLHWILVANGSARMALAPGAAPHGIYAETFAAWIALFVGLQVGAGLLFALVAPGSGILLPGALSFLLSLSALRWPVLRGVPWSRVRADLGLFLSPTPVRDALAGVACWAMAVPVMGASLLVSLVIMAVRQAMAGEPDPFAAAPLPSHPAIEEISGGAGWAGVLFLAAVCAPLVEEIFFRGALYRHLRDATAGAGRTGSVALSAGASGLLFAAVHPQGWTFVPLLFAISWGLVHAREWRGSLVAPVTAHALHNACVTLAAYTTFGG